MRGFAGPWVLLPGNHDAALAEGVWSRLERLGRPANVIVAASAEPDRAGRRPAGGPARTADRAPYVRRPDGLDGCRRHPVRCRCASASPTARSPGACPTTADAANPIDPRAGRPGAARLSGAGRLARHARDRPAHLVRRHARARPLPRQRRRQRAPGRAGRAGRAACGHAPAHRTARLAPAEPRSHRDRRPQGGAGSAARRGHRAWNAPWSSSRSRACSTWSRARRWKRRSTAGRASSATWRSATSWWPSPASATSSASANRR